MLRETEEKDLKKLEHLCHQVGLGFEIWSNSTRAMELKEENPTLTPKSVGCKCLS